MFVRLTLIDACAGRVEFECGKSQPDKQSDDLRIFPNGNSLNFFIH
jgi:hypothetical protein